MDQMNYHYGMDNFDDKNCFKKVESSMFKRKMVKSDTSTHLKMNNNLERKK
jgi:hypothetical protein